MWPWPHTGTQFVISRLSLKLHLHALSSLYSIGLSWTRCSQGTRPITWVTVSLALDMWQEYRPNVNEDKMYVVAVVAYTVTQLHALGHHIPCTMYVQLYCRWDECNWSAFLHWRPGWPLAFTRSWGTARRAVSWNLVKYCTNVQRIALEKAYNRGITFKVIQGH